MRKRRREREIRETEWPPRRRAGRLEMKVFGVTITIRKPSVFSPDDRQRDRSIILFHFLLWPFHLDFYRVKCWLQSFQRVRYCRIFIVRCGSIHGQSHARGHLWLPITRIIAMLRQDRRRYPKPKPFYYKTDGNKKSIASSVGIPRTCKFSTFIVFPGAF